MSDDEINAAIAESLGWSLAGTSIRAGRPPGADYVGSEFIPNYCNDLNAMHEAEEFLSGNSWIGYVNTLADIEGTLFGIRATARQRAEAFLRTLGKWKEAQP
jgi:hypothetical protein